MAFNLPRLHALAKEGKWQSVFRLAPPRTITRMAKRHALAEEIDLTMTRAIASGELMPAHVLGDVCDGQKVRIEKLRECLAAEVADVETLEGERQLFKLLTGDARKAKIFGADNTPETPRSSYVHGQAAMVTDIGRVREKNEDSAGYLELPDGRKVCVVADGNGIDGGRASRLAVQLILLALEAGQTLSAAILTANRVVAEELKLVRAPKNRLPGSTLVVAIIDEKNNSLQIGHVGDARAKWVGKDNAWLLTLDHSMRYFVYAAKHPDLPHSLPIPETELGRVETAVEALGVASNTIMANLGVANIPEGKTTINPPSFVRILELPLADSEGDATLVLYCDGAVDGVKETAISNVVRGAQTATEAAENIVNMAHRVSGDNITALALRLTGKKLVLSTPAPAAVPEPQPTTPPPPAPETSEGTALAEYAAKMHSLSPRQIIKLEDFTEQLRLLTQPLHPQVLASVIERYISSPSIMNYVRKMRNHQAAAVRAGADLVALAWLRKTLTAEEKLTTDQQLLQLAAQLAKLEFILDDLDVVIKEQKSTNYMVQLATENLRREIALRRAWPWPFGKPRRRKA